MSRVAPFYSQSEATKRAANRLYHNNSACPSGHTIPQHERRQGQGVNSNHRLCENCDRLNRQDR